MYSFIPTSFAQILFVRFIQVFVVFLLWFFSLLYSIPLCEPFPNLFTHSKCWWHFHISSLAAVNNVLLYIFLVCVCVKTFLGVRLLSHRICVHLVSLDTAKLFSKVVVLVYIHSYHQCVRVSVTSHLCQCLVLSITFISLMAHYVVLICISLITNGLCNFKKVFVGYLYPL